METFVIVLASLLCILGLGLLFLLVLALIKQNGRLLYRVDGLERALGHLGLVKAGPEVGDYQANRLATFLPLHPWVKMREASNDLAVLYEIVYENCYHLPETFDDDDVIVDLGAHAGLFALAVLDRGASEVHCFEPNPRNVEALRENVGPYRKRMHVNEAAVWRSDFDEPALYFQPPTDETNLGGGDVLRAAGQKVTAVALDDILREVSRDGERPIRLLKVDCEGSEYPILMTSKLLHLVEAICGEWHRVPAHLTAGWDFGDISLAGLLSYLQAAGFSVEYLDYGNVDSNAGGLFYGRRIHTP